MRAFTKGLGLVALVGLAGVLGWRHQLAKAEHADLRALDQELATRRAEYDAALAKAEAADQLVQAASGRLGECGLEMRRRSEARLPDDGGLLHLCDDLVTERGDAGARYEVEATQTQALRDALNALIERRNAKAATLDRSMPAEPLVQQRFAPGRW